MATLLSATAQHLDRIDEQVSRLRVLLLETAVVTRVPTPDLRIRALKVCVKVGLLTSPYCNLLRDVNYVIGEVAKWEYRAGA